MDKYIKMYSTGDVAKILNVSVATVVRRIKDGTLQAEKNGNRWYVTETQLREFINTNKAAQSCTYNLLPSRIEDIDGLKLFTPAEIAQRMRVTEQAVRKWIKQGKLKAIKPGGRVLIPYDYFVDFVNREYTITGFGFYKLMKDGRDPNLPTEDDDPPKIKE